MSPARQEHFQITTGKQGFENYKCRQQGKSIFEQQSGNRDLRITNVASKARALSNNNRETGI